MMRCITCEKLAHGLAVCVRQQTKKCKVREPYIKGYELHLSVEVERGAHEGRKLCGDILLT